MIAYLAMSQSKTATRDTAAGLLWSDSPEDQARASLRQCLKQIRDLFDEIGFSQFRANRHELALIGDSVRVDVVEAFEALEAGQVVPPLADGAVIPERILYGFEGLDQSFSAWLHVERQRWHTRFVNGLLRTLHDNAAGADLRFAAARGLIAIDETSEDACRHLMRHHAEMGNTAAAIRFYNDLWALLEEDFDVEPAQETQDLIVQIKSGTFVAVSRPVPGPSISAFVKPPERPDPDIRQVEPWPPTLEVSQFDPVQPTEATSYLVGGFRRDLIASLVRFREWIIVDGPADAMQADRVENSAGRVLGPDYRLEGSYFEDTGQVHLIMTLKDVASHRFIWSERYLLDLENWFAAQRQIVRRMSAGLNIHLSAQQVARSIANPDISTNTFDLWLQGNDLIWSWDASTRNRAEAIFRQVIERSPRFAPAYSGIASIYNTRHLISPGLTPNRTLFEEATQLARKSVDLDPLDVRGQVALAWSSAMTERFEHAELHYGLAVDLNANNPTTVISCANGLSMCGNTEQAYTLLDQALRGTAAPTPVQWAYVASTRFLCDDYDGCIQAAELSNDIITMVPGWRTAALGNLRRQTEAYEAGQYFLDYLRHRWVMDRPATDEAIVDWFLHHCPVRQPTTRDRIRDGLAYAGLPVPS